MGGVGGAGGVGTGGVGGAGGVGVGVSGQSEELVQCLEWSVLHCDPGPVYSPQVLSSPLQTSSESDTEAEAQQHIPSEYTARAEEVTICCSSM